MNRFTQHFTRRVVSRTLAGLALGCSLLVFQGASAEASPKPVELDEGARDSLELTVFNHGIAVVRDRRNIVMPTGHVELEFTGVAETLVPTTVSIASDRRDGFLSTRQTYRYDLLNRQTLLERFLGRKVKYSRTILEDGNFEKFLREGILLSVNPEIVKFGDIIEVDPVGTISLPYIPEDLKTTPTLVFRGGNEREGAQTIDVRYHASGLSWEADYAMVLDRKATLSGWVTLRNTSGTAFDIDTLSLVAGNLNTVTRVEPPMKEMVSAMRMSADSAGMEPQAVGDYHLYTVDGAVNLLKTDLTQIRLMSADGIGYKREYRVRNAIARYQQPAPQEVAPSVYVSFENIGRNRLGLPLPAGNVRFYEPRGDTEILVGEARIDHTARGEKISARIGQAFDLKARRTQTDYRRLGDRAAEADYTIVLMNGSDRKTTVLVDEIHNGDWEIIRETQRGRKQDAQTYEFEVDVPAEGEKAVSYTVRMTW